VLISGSSLPDITTNDEYYDPAHAVLLKVRNVIGRPPLLPFQSWAGPAEGPRLFPVNLPDLSEPIVLSHTRLLIQGTNEMEGYAGACTSSHCTCGFLPSGASLGALEALVSCDQRYHLVMQEDGNVVLLDGPTPIWWTNTMGSPGARLVMQPDGNLVVYSAADEALWATHTDAHPGAGLELQGDGYAAIYDMAGVRAWRSEIY